MISQSAEYSLRAVLCLASRDGAALTTQQIADDAQIPAGYLAKILQILGRAGIVNSQRGVNGGFTLAKAPQSLTLLEVVGAIEPSRRITECPLRLPEHALSLCPLHRRLDDAAAAVERILRNTTVSELIPDNRITCGCAAKEASHAGHAS